MTSNRLGLVGCTSKARKGDVRPRSQSASGLSQTRAYLAYRWGDTLLYYTLSWIPLCKRFPTKFYVAYRWGDTLLYYIMAGIPCYTVPCHRYPNVTNFPPDIWHVPAGIPCFTVPCHRRPAIDTIWVGYLT